MAYKFPSCALVPFAKLVMLANRESDGLMRSLSDASIDLIYKDMKTVGLIKEKFGRPTINISCDINDESYRSFFAPLQADSVRLLNVEESILNLDGFPVLKIATDLLSWLQFTDGRHRIKATNKGFPEQVYDQYVLCSITTLRDPFEMKRDSYKKSEERPIVYGSIHDALTCLRPRSFGASYNLELLKTEVKTLLGDVTSSRIDIVCKLHIHLFASSRKLLDIHRASELFTPDCINRVSGRTFIQFIQESGRLQLACYRYTLGRAFDGLEVREECQKCCILLCVHLSQAIPTSKHRGKALARFPFHLLEVLKTSCDAGRCYEKTDLPIPFADALKATMADFPELTTDVCRQIFHDVFGENDEALKRLAAIPNQNINPVSGLSLRSSQEPNLDSEDNDDRSPSQELKKKLVPQDSEGSEKVSEDKKLEGVPREDSERGAPPATTSETASIALIPSSDQSEHSIPSRHSAKRKAVPEAPLQVVNATRRSKRLKTQSQLKTHEYTPAPRQKVRKTTRFRRKGKQSNMRKKTGHISTSARTTLSPKASCALASLNLADKLLSKIVFLRLDCEANEYALGRLDRLEEGQGNDAIIIVDDAFLKTGVELRALEQIRQMTPNVFCIVSISETDTDHISSIVRSMRTAMHGVLECNSEEMPSPHLLYIKVHVQDSGSSWTGPARIHNIYEGRLNTAALEDFFNIFWCRMEDATKSTTTIYDLMLDYHAGVLRTLLKFGMNGFYLKCLSQEQEDAGLNTKYLTVLRQQVLRECHCGGHTLLDEAMESRLNEYVGSTHDYEGPEKFPLLIKMGEQDGCPFGNIFPHTSMFLRKDREMNSLRFANDDKALCSRETIANSNGIPIHRGAFISAETAKKLSKEVLLIDVLYPKSFIVDSLSKSRFYEASLSPFEMREIFVSGISQRKLWLFFSNRSAASLFNENRGSGEIHFTPRYMDPEYLQILCDKGFSAVRDPYMGLICCTLDPASLKHIPDTSKCHNCGAVELLTDYGREYIHD